MRVKSSAMRSPVTPYTRFALNASHSELRQCGRHTDRLVVVQVVDVVVAEAEVGPLVRQERDELSRRFVRAAQLLDFVPVVVEPLAVRPAPTSRLGVGGNVEDLVVEGVIGESPEVEVGAGDGEAVRDAAVAVAQVGVGMELTPIQGSRLNHVQAVSRTRGEVLNFS